MRPLKAIAWAFILVCNARNVFVAPPPFPLFANVHIELFVNACLMAVAAVGLYYALKKQQ
jgi:hypothetical protein